MTPSRVLGAAAVVLLAVGPWVLARHQLSLLTDLLIFGLFAMSLDLIMGYTGMLSFGHAAYFGLGAYGAAVQLVEGPREESEAEAIRQSSQTFYASHNWQPFFLEGTKSLAYEIWEDLGFRAPDNVIVPVGAGSSLLGCAFGFRELRKAGQIAKLPRLFAAQPLNCSPIDASFKAGADTPVAREVSKTIAEGTAIKNPLRLREIIGALRESGGGTVALTEDEIVAALRRLARQGLFAEPTSASAAAALDKLSATGAIKASETTVAVLTGTGLKAATTVADLVQ